MNSYWRCFFIKIKVKSCLKNITKKIKETISTFDIKNNNKITYHNNDTIIKIETNKDNLKITRDNPEFIHTFDFKLNKETNSIYYIKEYSTNIEVKIITTKLLIKNNQIIVNYIIKDSNDEYVYRLDME